MVFVGVDWAEAHHDVYVQDDAGKRLGGGRLPEGVDGIARFHELVARHVDEPDQVAIGIETDRGLFVAALVAAGYEVFAVNPMSTSRYRDRHSTSGAKSDPGDAKVLAEIPARTGDRSRRSGAGRVRRRAEPVCQRQVSQELRRHVADHPGVGHQAGRVGPVRPQPAPG